MNFGIAGIAGFFETVGFLNFGIAGIVGFVNSGIAGIAVLELLDFLELCKRAREPCLNHYTKR